MWREIGITARRAGILAGLAAAVAASPAAAQSPICADLQSQYLAAFGSEQPGFAGSGRSMVETDRISRELSNAQMAARQGNCNRFLFFGPRPSPQCPAIMATIGRLQQQLAQMRGSRSLFVTSPEQERERLRAWLRQNGCELPQAGGGGQRTICVRTCDGYFFPISFSTSSQRISRDAAVCQSMYAEAGQAEIFTHTTNRDVADARSVSGQRYGDQPYAFLFRRAFFPACAGQLKEGVAALGGRYLEARGPLPEKAKPTVAAEVRPRVPMPNMRPVIRQEDPETLANRRGQLAVAPHVPEDERATIVAGGRAMRLVGDRYYADLFDPSQPALPMTTHRAPLGFDLIGSAMAAIAADSERRCRPDRS
jgi:hypothetical protein